jgi:hypothetical protein
MNDLNNNPIYILKVDDTQEHNAVNTVDNIIYFTVYGQHNRDFGSEYNKLRSGLRFIYDQSYKHRNCEINTGTDSETDRPEIFKISLNQLDSSISIINPRLDVISHNPTQVRYNEDRAISNIVYRPETDYNFSAETYSPVADYEFTSSLDINYRNRHARQNYNRNQASSSGYLDFDNKEMGEFVRYPIGESVSSSWWVNQAVGTISVSDTRTSMNLAQDTFDTTTSKYRLSQQTVKWLTGKHYFYNINHYRKRRQ